MVKILPTLLVVLVFAACGAGQQTTTYHVAAGSTSTVLWHIDEDFDEPYAEYERVIMQDPRLGRVESVEPSRISWGPVPQITPGAYTLAYCSYPEHVIIVNEAIYTIAAPYLKEILWHELTHCRYMLLEHDKEPGHIFTANIDLAGVRGRMAAETNYLVEYIASHAKQRGN